MIKKSLDIKLAIAIPTYNEAKNIKKLVAEIKKTVAKAGVTTTVLIIDDNSPDGTGKIADLLKKSERTKEFKVEVLHRLQKNGLGKAYIDGLNLLLGQNFTHMMQMDADLSHNPKYIRDFLSAVQNNHADFVVGSRYIKGGSTPDWSIGRKLLSRFGNLYTRAFLGSRIHDYTGGYNLYSYDLLTKIDPSSLKETGGYGFLIELKSKATNKCNHSIEVPIIFMDRQHGSSKMPKSTLLKNLLLVLKIKLDRYSSDSF